MIKNKRLVTWFVLLAFMFTISGCGYIMYPDRRNAPKSDRIHTKVVVLDCLWLLAGIVPGVVALVVDGVHGTWYYSVGEIAENQVIVPGSDFVLNAQGLAPDEAEVELALYDKEEIISSSDIIVAKGSTMEPLELSVPENISQDAYMTLKVNGMVQMRWTMNKITASF